MMSCLSTFDEKVTERTQASHAWYWPNRVIALEESPDTTTAKGIFDDELPAPRISRNSFVSHLALRLACTL